MPTKNYQDFCRESLLEGRAETLLNFGWHFGRNDDLINSFWIWLTFSWWNIQADLHFGGSMLMQGLMNFRGRPPILKGGSTPRDNLSGSCCSSVLYFTLFHSQSKRKYRKHINFCKCLLYTFVVKCKRYVFVALVFTLTSPTIGFFCDLFFYEYFIVCYFTVYHMCLNDQKTSWAKSNYYRPHLLFTWITKKTLFHLSFKNFVRNTLLLLLEVCNMCHYFNAIINLKDF